MKFTAHLVFVLCGSLISFPSVAEKPIKGIKSESDTVKEILEGLGLKTMKLDRSLFIKIAQKENELGIDILKNPDKYFKASDIQQLYSVGINAYKEKKWRIALINLSSFKNLNKRKLDEEFSNNMQKAIDFCIKQLRKIPHRTTIQKAGLPTPIYTAQTIPTESESIILIAKELNPDIRVVWGNAVSINTEILSEKDYGIVWDIKNNEALIGQLLQENKHLSTEMAKSLSNREELL